MKIHTFWTREGCDEGDEPWLIAAIDAGSIEANNGYPRGIEEQVSQYKDARRLILQVPSTALRLWDPPVVQAVIVNPSLEKLVDELGIKTVTTAELQQQLEALRARFTARNLHSDEAINQYVRTASCTDDLVQEWIETTALLGGLSVSRERFYCRICQQELRTAHERDDHEAACR